jgi:2-polyprenyl-6-methoxyphenol hydroxylase-like FAD-dependent oxidoreductase
MFNIVRLASRTSSSTREKVGFAAFGSGHQRGDDSRHEQGGREQEDDLHLEQEADVAIVGAGLSGSLAAVVLGRAGYRVALIDRYAQYPPEFRVEKIGGDQVEWLRRLDLMDTIAASSTRVDQVINVRRGKVIDLTKNSHYGFLYQDLINVVRAQFPERVKLIVGKATNLHATPSRQEVELADGNAVNARLVIIATGMATGVVHKLGVVRKLVSNKHSVTLGFDIAPATGTTFNFQALTYYGETTSDCVDYLSLFPVGSYMRANLFTFRDPRDPWLRRVRAMPEVTLLDTLPGLRSFLGDFRITGKVQNWTMDLYRLENYLCDGVVLIGDAFQTSCPAAGTGVSRLLAEVHQLCKVYVPRWLGSPGMEAGKIGQFYADPVKQRSDQRAIRLSNYRRSLTMEDSWTWDLHRRQSFLRRKIVGWIRNTYSGAQLGFHRPAECRSIWRRVRA